MPLLEPTLDSIRDMNPIPAGLYKVEVDSHEEKVSKPNEKTGETSMNDWIVFKITDGEQSGRKIRKCFSEKFQTPGLRFFTALGAKIAAGEKLDFAKSVGRPLKISVTTKLFNNKPIPEVDDFLPVD